MFNFFKTRADLPVMEASPDKIRSIYRKYQWQVFLGLVLGYAMFYVVRMSLNVVKKPMLDSGVVTLEELGSSAPPSCLPTPSASSPTVSSPTTPT